MVEKPQLRIPEESVRQNSFELAAAGVAIATNASANSVVAGAAVNFKNCFILFFPVFGFSPGNRHGIGAMSAPSTPKNSNAILWGAARTIEAPCAELVL
jgi:hypothetical protein